MAVALLEKENSKISEQIPQDIRFELEEDLFKAEFGISKMTTLYNATRDCLERIPGMLGYRDINDARDDLFNCLTIMEDLIISTGKHLKAMQEKY